MAGEVLIRVEAAGVNYADTVRRWGDRYPLPTPLPFIAGAEVVGVIEATGAGVPPELAGRRVLAAPPCGGYAEFVVAPWQSAFALPVGLHPHQGLALFIQGLSAALILRQAARLAVGESVLVEGAAGGVGSLGVQLARLYGAGTVIGAASAAAKRAQGRALGADHVIDYTSSGWAQQVRELTGGRGVDVVMEMTGGDVFAEAMQCLASGGRVVVYGIASRKPYQVPSERLISSSQSVLGFFLGRYLGQRELIQSTLAELTEFVVNGRLKVEIGAVFPLAKAAEAHRLLESRHSGGKLVLEIAA
jgi:NADPH2:quinone reductase